MSANMADNPRPNNFRFRNEEDALYHMSRVAQLKIGSYVTYRDSEGTHNGVLVGVDAYGKPKLAVYDPEDGGFALLGVPPAAIIFDNMPAERADDFPRT